MRRSVWSRVTGLLLGFWFVAVTAAPEVMHACPMHGTHAGVATQLSDHGSHADTAVPGDTDHHSTSAPGHNNQCSCLGQCCSTGPVAVISTAITLADIVTVATRDAGLTDYAYVPVATRHVLPPAHAPPLAA